MLNGDNSVPGCVTNGIQRVTLRSPDLKGTKKNWLVSGRISLKAPDLVWSPKRTGWLLTCSDILIFKSKKAVFIYISSGLIFVIVGLIMEVYTEYKAPFCPDLIYVFTFLNYSWHTLYSFQVCNIMMWYLYVSPPYYS